MVLPLARRHLPPSGRARAAPPAPSAAMPAPGDAAPRHTRRRLPCPTCQHSGACRLGTFSFAVPDPELAVRIQVGEAGDGAQQGAALSPWPRPGPSSGSLFILPPPRISYFPIPETPSWRAQWPRDSGSTLVLQRQTFSSKVPGRLRRPTGTLPPPLAHLCAPRR